MWAAVTLTWEEAWKDHLEGTCFYSMFPPFVYNHSHFCNEIFISQLSKWTLDFPRFMTTASLLVFQSRL